MESSSSGSDDDVKLSSLKKAPTKKGCGTTKKGQLNIEEPHDETGQLNVDIEEPHDETGKLNIEDHMMRRDLRRRES